MILFSAFSVQNSKGKEHDFFSAYCNGIYDHIQTEETSNDLKINISRTGESSTAFYNSNGK